MHRVAALIDTALAEGVGSAAAVSIGDAGIEVARFARGHARRVPDLGEPIDESAWFDVASLTKPMVTAASVMVLTGEGRVSLDDSIRRWLPSAASMGTVRQLLGHAAGCVGHVEFFRALREGEHANPRAELVELAATQPAGEPGTATVYSDLGYILLGAIVERVTSLPLEAAFAELVARPLGLEARFPAMTQLDHAVATELDDRGLVCGKVHDENAYFGGGVCGHAGLFATIEDVARFAFAIVETFDGRAQGRFRVDTVKQFLTETAASKSSWRLGWDTPSAELGVSHAGDRWPRELSVGHLGFTGTSLWLDLSRRRWVALLTNRVHPSRNGSADAIKALRRAVNDAALEELDHDA
ncbi:MAG: serine hydrolase domain-containing protein [Kofleriaceae bacterium]